MDQTETGHLVIKRSRSFAMGYIAVSIFFTLFSCLIFLRSSILPAAAFLLCAVFCLALGIFMLKDHDPQITLNEQYITIKKIGQIPWSKIRSVRLEFRPRGIEFIILEFRDYKSEQLRIQVHGLDMTPNEIYDLISSHVVAD